MAGLLERDRELSEVERALGAAEDRRGGFAALTGPLGCGRSALLDAVCAGPAVDAFTVLRAACTAAEQRFAFGAVQQLFQPLLGARSATRTDALFAGPAAFARTVLVEDPWSEKHVPDESVLHALHALLLNLSSERPVLLVVDDVQWADTPSLTWLVYLAKRLRRARVLVLCAVTSQPSDDDLGASRSGDHADDRALRELFDAACVVLEPAPLSPAAVREMLGAPEDDNVVKVCCEITGGCPAAVAAVASALRAFAPEAADPADVHELCHHALLGWRRAAIAAAPTEARQLADALAVLGEYSDPDVLRELAKLDEIGYAAALRTLDGLGLLATADTPRFVHPGLPAALYGAMPRGTRERLHRTAAWLLHVAGQPAELVAEHLLPAGGPLDRWAVGVLRSAAVRAADAGAAGRAARLLRTAMLAGPADRRLRAQMITELAAAERDTDPLSCVQRVLNALPHLDPGPERVAAVLLLPPVLAASVSPLPAANVPPIGDLIRRVRDELAASDQAVLHPGPALRLEARVRMLDLFGDVDSGPTRARRLPSPGSTATPAATLTATLTATVPEATTSLGARVHDLLRSGAVDSGAGRELLAVLAWEGVLTGELAAGTVAALCDRVVQGEPADPAHVHTSLTVLVAAAVAADAVDSVEPWVERVVAAAQPHASAGVRACLAAEQVVVLAGSGRLERARKLGLDLLETTDSAWPATRILTASALVTVALQSQDIGLAERLLDVSQPFGDQRTQVAYRLLRGMLAAASRDLTGALEEFLEAGRDLAGAGWTDTVYLPWRVWAAMVYARLGAHEQAVELAEEELSAAVAWGGPTPLGRALRLLGTLTPGEAGLGLLRKAVDVHRGSPNRLELARSATVLGRALRRDRLPGAEQLLATGERIARDCDASWLEGTPDSEIVGPVPRLLRSGRDRLSPAEGAVVDLVQRGLNNARIAEDLNVTRRAVEKHLTNVYRKLGVAGRAALLSELAHAAPNLEPQSRPHLPNRFP